MVHLENWNTGWIIVQGGGDERKGDVIGPHHVSEGIEREDREPQYPTHPILGLFNARARMANDLFDHAILGRG